MVNNNSSNTITSKVNIIIIRVFVVFNSIILKLIGSYGLKK